MTKNIPLIHVTDLYHPPQDPDDHFDLATVYALSEIDLKAVILDATGKFLHPAPTGYDIARDPGFIAVMQMNYITGRSIPVASGPLDPLRNETDTIEDRAVQEQTGLELFLDVLRKSDEKVVISVVGSARVIAAAYNREPEMVLEKTRYVALNAASTGTHMEWNVKLDPHAFKRLWRSGLPIHWYPCAAENRGFDSDYRHATYWYARHEELMTEISPMLKAWFAHAYTGNIRGDILHILHDHKTSAVWEHVLSAKRNMWSTASLIMTAGRIVAKTEKGWRFIPRSENNNYDRLDLDLLPIRADVSGEGHVLWHMTEQPEKHYIFSREGGNIYREAMTQALSSLLSTL